MTNAQNIVEQFFSAFWGGDSQTARHYLAENLSFSGPGARFDTADKYLKAARHAQLAKGVQKHKDFVDGPDVAIFYELRLDPPVTSMAIAEWYHVEADKIASIRMIFDTGPFTAGAGEPSGETAVDPVCQMTVSKASAAATRSYGGVTYYFCSHLCGEAFQQEPRKYLTGSR